MMLIRMPKSPELKSGLKFVHYQQKSNFAYCTGRIKSVEDTHIVVDFGDMVISFLHDEIGYVINPDLGDEHYMSVKTGVVVADYRRS